MVTHGGDNIGGTAEVRSGAIAVLGNVEHSQARLRPQGDLLDDLGLGLGFDKAPVSSVVCMVAQRREHSSVVHAVPVSWRSVMGLHLW